MKAQVCSLIAAGCLAAADVAVAGGTISLDELEPLLRQKPEIQAFLMSSLEMDRTAMAAVRLGSHFKALGGTRVGPYLIQARPKTPGNSRVLEVVLCTDARFFDESEKETEDEANAVRLVEKLTVVMLRELDAAPPIPSCP